MADTLMGKTEIDAASKAEIANIVQSFLIQESKLIPTISNYSNLAVPGAKSVALPRSGGFTVGSKIENTAVDAQAITYAADTITFDQHKVVQFLLEDIADIQANIPVVQDAVMKATKALSLDIDLAIIEELKLASASAPDHLINFIDTATDVVAKADILAARKLLQDQNIEATECFIGIGPEKEAELLAIESFIDASKYGSNEPIMNGEIGKIYGMRVIMHTGFSDFMCTWHPSAVGLAVQNGMRYQTDKDLANLAMRHSIDVLYGVEVLDSGKRNVLTDSTN